MSLAASNAARTAMAVSQQSARETRQTLLAASDQLARELDTTESALATQTRQYSELEKTLLASEAARAVLALSKKSLDDQRIALVDRGRELSASLQGAEENLEAARQRTDRVRTALTEIQAERDLLVERGDELAEQLVSTRSELSVNQQRAATLEESLRQEQLSVIHFTETNEALEQRRLELVASGASLEEQLADAREQVARTRDETVTLLARVKEQQISNEQSTMEIARLSEELAAAASERSSLEQSLATVTDDRDREQTNVSSLNTDLARQATEMDRLRDAINLLERQLAEGAVARAKSEEELNEALQVIRAGNAQTLSVNVDLKKRIEDNTRTIGQLSADKQSLEKTLASVENELSTEKQSLIAAIEAAEQEIAEGQRAIEALRAGNLDSEQTEQQLRADIELLESNLKDREFDIERMSAELEFDRTRYQVLSDTMATIGNEKAALAQALAESKRRVRNLSTDKLRLSAEVKGLGAENEQLLITTDELEQERSGLYDRLQLDQKELEQLRFTYVDLKERYDKLVGPARSPIGRVVVDIRHFRQADTRIIELREPDWPEFREVTSEQLEERLARLAEQHNDNLYTRIIFPKNNGLTYTEALQFETSILERYDYYDRLRQQRSRG